MILVQPTYFEGSGYLHSDSFEHLSAEDQVKEVLGGLGLLNEPLQTYFLVISIVSEVGLAQLDLEEFLLLTHSSLEHEKGKD